MFDAAVEHQREVVAFVSDSPIEVGRAQIGLAVYLACAGRHAEAIELGRSGIAAQYELLRDDHPQLAVHAAMVGVVEAMGGELEAAERRFADGYRRARVAFGDAHPHTRMLAHSLGQVVADRGDPARAVPWFREALAISDAEFPLGHPLRRQTLSALARAEYFAGALDDCVSSLRRVVDELEAIPSSAPNDVVRALVEVAEVERSVAARPRSPRSCAASSRGSTPICLTSSPRGSTPCVDRVQTPAEEAERAATERERAAKEHQAQRADEQARRADRLAARLRELGIDPDTDE